MARLGLTKLAGLLSLAVLLPQSAWAVDVTVSLDYSTYVGTAQTGGTGVTQWLGIRYAAPPLGNLRFARPQDPLVVVNTTQLANEVRTTRDSYMMGQAGAQKGGKLGFGRRKLLLFGPQNRH